jgi:hypothetical protein
VRAFLLVAVIAFLFVAGLLFVLRGAFRRERAVPKPVAAAPAVAAPPAPDRIPEIAARVRAFQRAPESQQLLADFVRDCAERGAAAVPELLDRLRHESDVQLQTRWDFQHGRLRGFPSLRSAYIGALLLIPGQEAVDALLETVETTLSANEAYQIAAGLVAREEGGFTRAAIDRALKAGPGDAEVARDLIALAARADPEGTAGEIALRSPRGEDPADPALLAEGLEGLPLERASATGQELCADPRVTRKAKERYLRSLCDRGEPELLARLRELAQGDLLDRELKVALAYAAAGSRAFYADQAAYGVATAGGEGPPPEEIRARYERRLLEVEQLIAVAVAPDNGPALESLRRRLTEQRARLR